VYVVHHDVQRTRLLEWGTARVRNTQPEEGTSRWGCLGA
jgi:hypothetical protein